MHNLEAVSFVQNSGLPLAPGNNFAIEFDGDTVAFHTQLIYKAA